MKIRKIKKVDLSQVLKLYFSIWQGKVSELKKYFMKKVKNKEGFVAIDKDKVIGFIGFARDYFKDVTNPKNSSDYLDWVFVDKNYRKKGIAEILIKKFEEDAKKRKIRRIFSTTVPKNIPALKMHKKLGFRQVGYVWHLWEEGDKELFFSKKLI